MLLLNTCELKWKRKDRYSRSVYGTTKIPTITFIPFLLNWLGEARSNFPEFETLVRIYVFALAVSAIAQWPLRLLDGSVWTCAHILKSSTLHLKQSWQIRPNGLFLDCLLRHSDANTKMDACRLRKSESYWRLHTDCQAWWASNPTISAFTFCSWLLAAFHFKSVNRCWLI